MWRKCDVQRFHEHWMLKWSWIRDLNMFVELSVCGLQTNNLKIDIRLFEIDGKFFKKLPWVVDWNAKFILIQYSDRTKDNSICAS